MATKDMHLLCTSFMMTPKTMVLPFKVLIPISELRVLVLPQLVSPTPMTLDMALVAQVQLTTSTHTITSPSHMDHKLAQAQIISMQASSTTEHDAIC